MTTREHEQRIGLLDDARDRGSACDCGAACVGIRSPRCPRFTWRCGDAIGPSCWTRLPKNGVSSWGVLLPQPVPLRLHQRDAVITTAEFS